MNVDHPDPVREIRFENGISLALRQGDITHIPVDVIVNAANKHLQHGGGVAGAISRYGGPVIQQESNAWIAQHGSIDEKRPAYTRGGNLPCTYVIHTAGPIWGEGDEDRKLSNAIINALQMAERLEANSLSMPAISTGIFGFPVKRAAGVFMQTLHDFCTRTENNYLKKILVILFDQKTLEVFINAFEMFPWENTRP